MKCVKCGFANSVRREHCIDCGSPMSDSERKIGQCRHGSWPDQCKECYHIEAQSRQVGGDHYRDMPIQPEAFIYANGIGWHEGCAIAYLCRWREKGGITDLEKARHTIELLIAHEREDAAVDAAKIGGEG